jgi:hypothetical protein
MRTTHHIGSLSAAFAAALACSAVSLAQAQQPAITLVKPVSSTAEAAPAAGGNLQRNPAAIDYREFKGAKVGERAAVETFTLSFHETTKVTGISISGDFRITGSGCIEGHTYAPGNVCSVDVTFTPQGPGHRTGSLSVAHTASATPFLTPIGGTAYGPVVSFIPSQIQTVPGTYSSGGTLSNPQGLTIDGGDNLYIADTGNNLIKFRDSSGTITSIVGGGTASAVGYSGFGSGIKLTGPRGVAADYSGTFYISDTGDSVVLVRYIDGILNTRIGGGATGSSCSYTSPCLPYNVKITPPYSIASDPSGNVYTTLQVGGSLPGFYLAENQADNNNYYLLNTTAYNYYTTSPSLGVDLYSNLYYTYEDPGGPLLSPTPLCYVLAQNRAYSTSSSGQRFWTVAGSGPCGFSGDGGKATGAEISKVIGQFAFDVAGNFYFADTGNNRIRRVDAASGIIRTVAGNGVKGFVGDGGPATNATLDTPTGLAVDSSGQIYVTGLAGTAPKADIRVIGTKGILNFSGQPLSAHSPAQTILVSNTGNDTLNFTHVGLSSGNIADFAIDPNTTSCNLTLPLYSGKSCNIGVIFTPSAAGARSAVMTILDDTITGSNFVQLNGTGLGPAKATLTPTTEAFNPETVNVASGPRIITLANTGGVAMTISSYTFTGANPADFTQTHTCGATLNGGATCTISVIFKPAAIGAKSATLSVVTSGGTVTAALTGSGLAAAAVAALSPTSLTFASQTVGTASVAKSFTLSNTGGSSLTISSYAFTGTNAGDFSQTHNCGTTLAAGASCIINIAFKPTAAGTRLATLSVATTAGTVSRSLSGTGVAAAAVKPKVTLSSTFNPAVNGQVVVLRSTVGGTSSAKPTGNVRLMEGPRIVAQASLAAGSVTFKRLNLSPGKHMLTAFYLGDNLHKPSNSVAIRQIVGKKAALDLR